MANSLKHFLVFMVGFFIGAILAVVYLDLSKTTKRHRVFKEKPSVSESELYEASFRKSGYRRWKLDPDFLAFDEGAKNYITEANYLYRNVSLTCVVFIEPKSNQGAYDVTNTWGKKCNRLIFFGEKNNHFLNVKRVNSIHSWQYLCEAIKYIWTEYKYDLQWVLFSPDYLFVIPENLRYVLAHRSWLKGYYIGHKVMFWNQIYNDASAGYVLSYKAIELLMERFSKTCATSGKYLRNEDYFLGLHLGEVGVFAADAVDDKGLQRFHLFSLDQLLPPGSFSFLQKYSQKSLLPPVKGSKCCSSTTVSFQTSGRDSVHLYNYLLYNANVFTSGSRGNNVSLALKRSDKVWKKFVSDEFKDLDPELVSNEDYYKMWTLKVNSPDQFNEKLKKLFQSGT